LAWPILGGVDAPGPALYNRGFAAESDSLMPIADKVAAANRIKEYLDLLLTQGGFRLKYRITVNPAAPAGREHDWDRPEISVELAGPDSPMLLERNGELMRSMEYLALKILHLEPEEHDKVSFDSQNFKAMRLEELRIAANVAAEKVRKTGVPYPFSPMSARERRMVHLALREFPDLRTESAGEAAARCVVVYPKDYKGAPVTAAPGMARGRRR
jgi:spoIIIJ-associated protein